MIKVANKNSQRLIGLVNDILDMDKLLSGKMTMHIERFDLAALAQQSIEDNAGYALGFDVIYVLGAHPAEAQVMADRNRLLQVLANLLSNAAKFSAKGTRVEIRILPQEACMRVEVEDRGPGIPLEFQASIFGEFAQADSTDTRQRGGTGLGLNITKKLVEQMGGAVGYTTVQQGTVFWFTVPTAADAGA